MVGQAKGEAVCDPCPAGQAKVEAFGDPLDARKAPLVAEGMFAKVPVNRIVGNTGEGGRSHAGPRRVETAGDSCCRVRRAESWGDSGCQVLMLALRPRATLLTEPPCACLGGDAALLAAPSG